MQVFGWHVHDFVYMTAEGRDHRIAYLEDMFEDSKARKLVWVQWFYKTNEVLENIPPPVPLYSMYIFSRLYAIQLQE